MLDGRRKSDITLGMAVRIVEKKNQKTGVLTEGIVTKILTDSPEHPYGIMVELSNGAIGRVKEIVKIESQEQSKEKSDESDVLKLIANGENSHVEFKASFRVDVRKFQATGTRDKSKEVEKSISKVVASFMNAEGGIIVIGVSDEGKVVGIEEDLALLNKQNLDTFRLQLKNSLESYLRDKLIYEHITIDTAQVDNLNICVIRVTSAPEPVFVHDEGRQECYIRVDNESKPFQYDEFHRYWERKQGRKN